MNQQLADYSQIMVEVTDELGWPSLCTIEKRLNDGGDPPVNAEGQPDQADFIPISGLTNIPCRLSVWRAKPDMAAVQRLADRFDVLAERHVLLNGYFPQILQRNLAVVDGVTYEIMSVENDSTNGIMTRLAVRLFNR